MSHCGYCNHEQDNPCTDAQDAKKCGEPFYPDDEDDDRIDCEFCGKNLHSVCINKYMALGCAFLTVKDDGKVLPDDWEKAEAIDKPARNMRQEIIDDYVARGSAERAEEGRKDDTGKTRMELLPPEMLFAVSEVLTFGANKYDDRNWEKGMKWGRVFGATMRHLWSWWAGNKKDPETGMSHLWHAACCITFLIAYEDRGIGEDDRYKGTNE